NAALLPFLLLGLAWSAGRWRERHNALLVIWFGLAFFPAALLLGAVWVRAVYAAYPAIDLLAAIGIWWSYTSLRGVVRPAWQPRLAAGAVGLVALIALFSSYIYFREVKDFDERMHRRELGDELAASVAPGRLVYAVFQPARGDFIDVERPFM